MSIAPMQPVGSDLRPETANSHQRRYPEIYEWSATQELEGRKRMRTASVYGVLVGGVFLLFGFLFSGSQRGVGVIGGLVVGGLVGAAVYQWRYDSGLRMVLDAQRTLVAVDTEHNTRNMLELMRVDRNASTHQTTINP